MEVPVADAVSGLDAAILPADADAPERRRDAAPMRALVKGLLQRLNLSAQEVWREDLDAVWPAVAPPTVAATARPGKWENGILYLHVKNSAALFQIQRFHLRALERALIRRLGPDRLKQVRVMIDPNP